MFARLSNMFGGNDYDESSNTVPSNLFQSPSGSGTPLHNDDSQQFKIDNSASILDKIANLYAERLMSDIVIVVGEKEFHAHRLILCASSDVFEIMLMNPQWSDSQKQKIFLQEAPECIEVFEMFLKYMYTGQLKVTHGSVLPILGLADKYNVKDLINTCCKYMDEHIVSATKHNFLISWLQYAMTCGHKAIAQSCMNHLKWNFEQVAQTKDFATCDVTLLTTVLSQNDVVVEDELTLYNHIVNWLQHQEEHRPMMTPVSTPGESLHLFSSTSRVGSLNSPSAILLQATSTLSLDTPPINTSSQHASSLPSSFFKTNFPLSHSSVPSTYTTTFSNPNIVPMDHTNTADSRTSTKTKKLPTSLKSEINLMDGVCEEQVPYSHVLQFTDCQPSINPSKTKYHFRREITCSSTSDPVDQMEHLTYEVMRFVRFPMMTPRQLADLLLDSLTIKYKEFFVTRMAIGMSFHSAQWNRIKEVLNDPDSSNQLLFTPRLYTAEKWSAGLSVDNLPSLPAYHTRTLFFSTPASASELENDTQLEWIVELYPKGVWFRKFFLIVWHGTVEVPESVLRTVRLSITAKDAEYARVRISVLVYGVEDGIEHVVNVVSTRHIFTPDDTLLNIDDILSFDTLNHPLNGQKYLLDPCSALKIHVVINPLSDPKLGGRLIL